MTADEFERRVRASIPASVDSGSRLLLGISGGADSVALLRSLIALRMKINAVHCNFHLRGKESTRDEMFVRRLCETLDVPLIVKHFDTDAHIRRNGGSVEMACRDLRYAFFREEQCRTGCIRIAVAHNADDNAETFMLALMRGAGLKGLKAMTADTGEILRPLIHTPRKDIEKYLESLGQPFITDSTNLQCDFNRNFVRLKVLPLLHTRWPEARGSISTSISNLAADFRLLSGFLDEICEKSQLPYSAANASPAPESLIFHFIRERGGSRSQATEMARSARKPSKGARWTLSPRYDAVCGRDGFEIIDKSLPTAEPRLISERLPVSDSTLRLIKAPDGNRTLYLPDNPDGYLLRLRRDGDFIRPLGMKGKSRVSDIVKDAKLNAEEARGVFVLEHIQTKEVIWIPGLKRSRCRLVDLSSPPPEIFRLRLEDNQAFH